MYIYLSIIDEWIEERREPVQILMMATYPSFTYSLGGTTEAAERTDAT